MIVGDVSNPCKLKRGVKVIGILLLGNGTCQQLSNHPRPPPIKVATVSSCYVFVSQIALCSFMLLRTHAHFVAVFDINLSLLEHHACQIRRYCLFISYALLHFSLAGGFSVPKITKVLNSTGYLSGKKTKERVLETSQFVLDVVHSIDYLQPGTGVAWESIVQVRFLHASVRARLSKISRTHSK
jgi:hypothetical protein